MSAFYIMIAGLMLSFSATAEPKDNIQWVLLDFPPFLDVQNVDSQDEVTLARLKGPIADIHKELARSLPDFKHSYRMASFRRAQKLFEAHSHHCTILFLKTPEREKYLVYGGIIASTIPPGLVIDENRRDTIEKFVDKSGMVDLHKLLTDSEFKLGTVEGRSFSNEVDNSMNASQTPITKLVSDRAMASLFQMVATKRLDGALAYYLEMSNEQKSNSRTKALRFYPLKQDQSTINLRVSCERSPWGELTVKKISDAAKKETVREKISTLLMQTLPPESRKPASQEKYNSLQ